MRVVGTSSDESKGTRVSRGAGRRNSPEEPLRKELAEVDQNEPPATDNQKQNEDTARDDRLQRQENTRNKHSKREPAKPALPQGLSNDGVGRMEWHDDTTTSGGPVHI